MKFNQIKKILNNKKGIIGYSLFAIVLCAIIFLPGANTNAAGFQYKDFKWDDFYQNREEYWEESCRLKDGTVDSNCVADILLSQKRFYTKFYKALAKYDAKGLHIDDNIILETVFFELSPSLFSDESYDYNDLFDSVDGLYKVDASDEQDPNMEDDYENESAARYFEQETDTIKTLAKNMIAYTTSCYGIIGDPTKHEAEDGSVRYSCDEGGSLMSKEYYFESKCVDTIQASNEMGFWKYFVSKWAYDTKLKSRLFTLFLRKRAEDENYDSCMETTGYNEMVYTYNDEPMVSTNKYFDFLSENEYFDNKAHLQHYFKESILEPAGVDCLKSTICDNSLEAAGLYEEYEAQLIENRRDIIYNIIGIINNYYGDEDYLVYDPVNGSQYKIDEVTAARKSYYWPIGSDETEERNGVVYADKEPASTEVISYFGTRTNPATGETEDHRGIDIKGEEGVTNVVAVYRGEVLTVVNNCTVGDYTCNEGLGNTIILAHSNGDYTVYAHLASVDSSVTVGSTVDKGQLIGKVGRTGAIIDPCLHYELRQGGNSSIYNSDPLDTTDPTAPRPQVAAGDFAVHGTSLSKEEFVSKLRSYCNSNSCSSEFMNVFVANAETVYDVSIANNVNPELVVIRGAKEGMSPGGSTHNYWGIACYNGAGASACTSYASLEAGIAGFAKVVSGYETVSQMMSRYAYIGKVWYNPGSWSLGGCKYFPYISQYMSAERQNYVSNVCNNGPACATVGQAGCTSTTDEDQHAYTLYNISGMVNMRYVAFGL